MMITPIGYFRIHRELFYKPIWKQSTPEQKTILLTVLAMAWFNGNEWEWNSVKFKTEKGQFVTSLQSIADDAGKGISIQNVRSSLKRFEKLQFLTSKATKQGRVITILNWNLFQTLEKDPTKKPTKEATKTQQRPNKDPTTKEEGKKKRRKEDNNIKDNRKKFGEFENIKLSETEYKKLIVDMGETKLYKLIGEMDEWIEMKGKNPYKNFNLALRKWNKNGINKKSEKPKGRQINESTYDTSIEMGF